MLAPTLSPSRLVVLSTQSFAHAQCDSLQASYGECFATNAISCGLGCAGIGQPEFDDDRFDGACLGLRTTCENLLCCPPCLEEGKGLTNCIYLSSGCESTCDDALVPTAPTPTAPQQPAPTATADGTCSTSFQAYEDCVLNNLATCSLSCEGQGELDLGTCGGVEDACRAIGCCQECIAAGKTALNCVIDANGCSQVNCDSVAPIVPAPTPLVIPSPILAGDSCTAEQAAFSECFTQNLADCAICEEFEPPGASCDSAVDVCQELTCCPPCLAEGQDVVNCIADDLGCGTVCDVAAPIPLSPVAASPLTEMPVTQQQPVSEAPTAPTTVIISTPAPLDMTASPATTSPVDDTTEAPITPAPMWPTATTTTPVTPSSDATIPTMIATAAICIMTVFSDSL